MQLKPEALNALKLPVRVKAGFLGSVKLKVGPDHFVTNCNTPPQKLCWILRECCISYWLLIPRVFLCDIFLFQVPWSRLGQDPVLVHLDRIFLLAEPETQVEGCSEDAVQEAKKSRVRVRQGEPCITFWKHQVEFVYNKMILCFSIPFVIGNGNANVGEGTTIEIGSGMGNIILLDMYLLWLHKFSYCLNLLEEREKNTLHL